jgi:hypothetical protein
LNFLTFELLELMKLKLTLLILFIAVIALPVSFAQRIMGAAIVGVNATQVDGDEVYGFHKFGLNTGLAAIVPFGNNWSVSLETIYNQKGAHQKKRANDSLDGSYDLKLNYLEVPFLIQYTDKGHCDYWNRHVVGTIGGYIRTTQRLRYARYDHRKWDLSQQRPESPV